MRWMLIAVLSASAGAEAARAQGSAAANITVNDLEFGAFARGIDDAPRTMTMRICNIGSEPISFSRPGDPDPSKLITWDDSSFSIDQSEIAALATTTLQPNDCININVAFDPMKAALGNKEVVARIWANTRATRDTSIWRAVVVEPGVTMLGLDFGLQWVIAGNPCTKNTATGYDGEISVGNIGPTSDTVVSLVLEGKDVVDGFITFDKSDPLTTISAGDVIEGRGAAPRHQKIRFAPTEERYYNAQLTLRTRNGRTIVETVRGAGGESHLAIPREDLGTVAFVGAYPATQALKRTVVIRALLSRPTIVTSLELGGGDASEFWIDPSGLPAFPTVLVPGDTMAVAIEFRPRSCGAKSAVLTVQGDHSPCDSAGRVAAFADCSHGVEEDAAAVERFDAYATAGGITMRYALRERGTARIEVYDAIGRRVAALDQAENGAGTHTATWGDPAVASGVYYCRLIVGNRAIVTPVVFVR